MEIRFGNLEGGGSGGDVPETHFKKTFYFSDVPLGVIPIATVPQGQIVKEVVIDISEAFDGGVIMTIGDDGSQGILMTASENTLGEIGKQIASPDYQYHADTEVKMFFSAATPTIGTAVAILYVL